ncbi:MAG: hypothetical protein ACKVP5_13715 [Aestuariivirga sp.]
MKSLYPPNIQTCLLFDTPRAVSAKVVASSFADVEARLSGTRYNPLEVNGDAFVRLYGTNDMMITIERIDGPANATVFAGTLNSGFTRLALPDSPQLVARHASHMLVNVHHGAIPPMDALEKLMGEIGMTAQGHSLEAFKARLKLAGLLTTIAHDEGNASLIHWTQSNTLVKPQVFAAMAKEDPPSPIHIHPRMWQEGATPSGEPRVGFVTLGASHFIGREISVKPTHIPWVETYQGAYAFLKLAVMRNGYIIPDGDTFGDEDQNYSYRARHIAERNTGETVVPAEYQLELLMSKKHSFTSPDYVPPGGAAGTRGVDEEQRRQWAEQGRMAEAAGVRLEVRARTGEAPARPVFGKRH